jgi:shikimate dehydrogenase
LRTKFLEEAAAIGCVTVDGLGMLLHQAAPAFERWFGIRPEVNEATRAAILAE